MRSLPLLLLLCVACQPAMFLPTPGATSPAGVTRVLHRSFELTYAVAVEAGQAQLGADSVERVQLLVGDANDQTFARWNPQDGTRTTTVQAAAARLTRKDGSEVLAQPPAGAILELPPLAAGDRVDVFVRRHHALPQAAPPWVMAMSVPVDDLQVRVQAAEGLSLRVVRGEGVGKHAEMPGEGGLWVLREMQLAASSHGPTAAPPRHDGPWLLVVPVSYHRGDVDTRWADSWDSVAAYVRGLLVPTTRLDAATAAELRTNVHLVTQRFKPTATEALLPSLPRAFAALAQATPLEAAAVAAAAQPAGQLAVALVSRPEGAVVLPEVPGLYAFETALWAEPQNLGWLFSDPTCDHCRSGEVAFEAAGGQALVLGSAGPTQLTQVPLAGGVRNLRRTQFSWDLSVEGKLRGEVVAEFEGPSARKLRAALLAPNDAAGRREAKRQLLFQGGAQINLQAVDSPAENAVESAAESPDHDADEGADAGPQADDARYAVQLSVRGKAALKQQAYELTPAAVAGDGFPWDVVADAPGDVLLPGPLALEASCTLQTPGGFVGKRAPKPVLIESPFGKYEARFVQKQSMVVYTRRLNLTARVVPRDQRAQLAAFAAQIRAAESTPLLLRTEE